MKVSLEELKSELEKRTGNRFIGGELAETKQLCDRLTGCRSFVDAGSNWGQYAWAANLVLSNASIMAIEANPELCKHIERQCQVVESEGADGGNRMKAVNAAVSDKQGAVLFGVDKDNPLNSIMGDVAGAEAGNQHLEMVEVKATTLDELFPDSPPDFVKMDIEGAEWRGLKGSEKIISKKTTSFLIEIHPWGDAEYGKRPSHVFKFMRERGYGVERLSRHWLFTPQSPSLVQKLQSFFYGFVLNRPRLRKAAKKILIGK